MNFRDEYEKVIHSNDAFAPVGYLKLNRMHLVKKTVSFSFIVSTIDYNFYVDEVLIHVGIARVTRRK